MLFDPDTLRKLERLSLAVAQARAGALKGERRSTRRGTSIEFADYRDYARGDDLRRVDWNVYARLERPFVKILEEQEDLAVHVLVDESRSMAFGAGADNKFDYARRLAAALGYIALAAGDRLTAAAVQGASVAGQYGPARGRGHALRLLRFLEARASGGQTDLDGALDHYARTAGRPGLLLLISDLFSPQGCQAGLKAARGRGFEVAVLHVLAPDEIDPPVAGDLRLVDVETGAAQEVSLNAGLLDLYRRRLQAWQDELGAFCLRYAISYVPVTTALAWDQLVLHQLRRRGLIH